MRGCTSAVLAMVSVLLASSPVLAEGYGVVYGIVLSGSKDTGSIDCSYDDLCIVRVPSLKLKFKLSVLRRVPKRAHVSVDGEAGCCLLEGAVWRLAVDPREKLLRLRLFVGRQARGLEYIENEYVGNLYLKFRFRDDPDSRGRSGLDGSL